MTRRTALITGGAQGIGKGITKSLAQAGFSVVIADLNIDTATATATELNDQGLSASAVQMDVTDTASVENAVHKAEETAGPIDVLVNNAGWDDFMPFLDTTED